jgi:hypothetical protein
VSINGEDSLHLQTTTANDSIAAAAAVAAVDSTDVVNATANQGTANQGTGVHSVAVDAATDALSR